MRRIVWILIVITFLLSFIAYELALILDGIQTGSSLSGLVFVPILLFGVGIPVSIVVYVGYLLVLNIIEPR